MSSSSTRDEDSFSDFMTPVYDERIYGIAYGTGEMEEISSPAPGIDGILHIGEEDLLGLNNEPTSSGLFLTHRTERRTRNDSEDVLFFGAQTPFLREIEPERRKRMIVLVLSGCFVVLVAVLGVQCLGIQHRRGANDRIWISTTASMTLSTKNIEADTEANTPAPNHEGRGLRQLRAEFDEWASRHERSYDTDEERQRRFRIWLDNHHRTMEKNNRHGPCKLTGKQVFGSNHFKDLTPLEFQQRFLSGYNPPMTDELGNHRTLTTDKAYRISEDNRARRLQHDLESNSKNQKHKDKKRRYIDHRQPQPSTGDEEQTDPKMTPTQNNHYKNFPEKNQHKKYPQKTHRRQDTTNFSPRTSSNNSYNPIQMCGYKNWSCWLQWLFDSSSYGGMMEPAYDADSYPEALDWRDMGAVSDIHSQGQCGACWAIAAVETVESALYIGTGTLYELAEEEVILCDDTCDMCYGGWPQNAYEYIMKNGGLPTEKTMEFNGDFLLAITMVKNGQSDYYSEDAVDEYLSGICPAYGNSHKDSGDNDNENNPRYGQIQGYGYATDRCICYTNGSGCDCDEQDEELAIANVASYGPAVVCLDASTWQDYEGGIMTAESGCSSEFLSMNHCVQVVGYAFTDSSDGEDGEHRREQSSHSQKEGGGREGYWIVRNQWSSYWGMNGYAYVAMGGGNTNTCGILNDMTQAYM